MLGAFVPVALKEPAAHADGIANAVKTARLLAAVAGTPAPYLVLADEQRHRARTHPPGRTRPSGSGLTRPSGECSRPARTGSRDAVFAGDRPADRLPPPLRRLRGNARRDRHPAGAHRSRNGSAWFSTPAITATAPAIATWPRPSSVSRDRVWYIHCKDCQPDVARQARAEQWDYFTALRHGVFCELGKGCVDFPALLRWLAARHYAGYVLVEQDVLPGMGTPKESARRNREYLRSIEGNFQ